MCKSWLLCVLLGALAWGQSPSSAPPPSSQLPAGRLNTQAPPAEKDNSASVPDSAPVLTIDGICEPQAKTVAKTAATAAKPQSTACKTVITKAQFEALANNLAPNITPQMKKQLAGVLPRLMAMSNAAKKEGLENTPQFKERVKFSRMQILAQQLQQKLQEQAANVPEADAEKYYKDHSKDFEQYSLERLFIPRTKQVVAAAGEQPEKGAKAGEPEQKDKEAADKTRQEEGEQAMGKLAQDLRGRAVAGEDFLKLQKEAFEAAGMKIESPTVSLQNVRRTTLPQSHADIFDLKTGEVSQVISDTGGHYIYKLNSKSEMPLDQAKNEIHTRLQNERMKEEMDKVNNSFKVETNEAYFGPGGASPMSPRPTRPGPSGASGGPQNPPSAQNQAAKPQ